MVLSSTDPNDHRKPCTICSTPRDVLIRCKIDDSGKWHLVCPGKCWHQVSGGVEDGDAAHPHYRYGGAWKNKYADVTAKKPKAVKERQKVEREEAGQSRFVSGPASWVSKGREYEVGDEVVYRSKTWVCRKAHPAGQGGDPIKARELWRVQGRDDEEHTDPEKAYDTWRKEVRDAAEDEEEEDGDGDATVESRVARQT